MSLKKTHKAFTLLEILIVMVVMGAMATIISPWLFRKRPSAEWPAVLDNFNNLVTFARQEAVSNQKTYRLFFFKSKTEQPDFVMIEQEERDPEKPDKKIYKQVFSSYFDTKYKLPDTVRINAIYKNKKEQFEENKGKADCFVIPSGLVQEVMIHLVRKVDNDESRVTFEMSPFFGEFNFDEGFIKPVR